MDIKKSFENLLSAPINFIMLALAWAMGAQLWSTLLLLFLGNLLWVSWRSGPKKRSHPHQLTQEKIQHYRAHGLKQEDMHYFRQEMQATLEKINYIIAHQKDDARIAQLVEQLSLMPLLKNFFQQLTAQPEKLSAAAAFRFGYLEDLYQCFQAIARQHATAEPKQRAQWTEDIIQLTKAIALEYEKFLHKND